MVDGTPLGIPKIMKLLNFVEDFGFYEKGFTRVYIENNDMYIGHTFNINKLKIDPKDLIIFINYFNNI